jgi:hypothetical protein
VELFADLPKEIRRGIYTAKTGHLKIRVELNANDMQPMVMRGVRLLALASITSAALIGGAIVHGSDEKAEGVASPRRVAPRPTSSSPMRV